MYKSKNDNISILSSTNGFYYMKPNGEFIKSKNKYLSNWLIESIVAYNGDLSFFSDGSIPIISNDGILILDDNEKIINLIDETDGFYQVKLQVYLLIKMMICLLQTYLLALKLILITH